MFFFYVDCPVSKSGEFAAFLRERMEVAGIPALAEAVKSPDKHISMHQASDLIATSDSVLIDSVKHCVDIPDLVFRGIMEREILDLQQLVKDHPPRLESLQ